MKIKIISFLLVFLIAGFFVSADEVPEEYQLIFIYDGKNFNSLELRVIYPESQSNFVYDKEDLSPSIDYSKDAPFGAYNIELVSLNGLVVEKSEFLIINNLSQTPIILVPYSEKGALLKISYPDGAPMFVIDVSRYAPEYENVSKETKQKGIENIMNISQDTGGSEYEKQYRESRKWFVILVIACVILIGFMLLYVWKYKMAR